MSSVDSGLSDFRGTDVKKNLKELGDESTSPDRMKSILKTFLLFSFENQDAKNELLTSGIVEVLVRLYFNEKGKILQGQIATVITQLSFEENTKLENSSDIILTALSNIFSKSDLCIFLQCISGIKEFAIHSATGSSSSSSSSPSSDSSSPSIPCHFLSVSSSAAVFEKTEVLLSSSTLDDMSKMQVLHSVLQLVGTSVMNEAAEFVKWRQLQNGREGGGGGDGGGERGTADGNSAQAADRFSKAFEDFAKVLKKISLVKYSVLGYAAIEAHRSIQENKFFPMHVSCVLKETDHEKQKNVDLPLKFLANSSSNVSNSGNKLVWNSSSGSQDRTFYVDKEMIKGIYKVIVELSGVNLWSNFGLAVKKHVGSPDSGGLYSHSSGTCCIHSDGSGIYCGGSQIVSAAFYSSSSKKTTLALELDANKHTLHFFVNGTQISHCVVNVPQSVYFGISGYYEGLTVELKSFVELKAPTIDPSLSCAQYAWK